MDVAYEVRKANIPKVEYTFPYKLLESRKEIRRKNQEPKLTKKKKYIYIYIYEEPLKRSAPEVASL